MLGELGIGMADLAWIERDQFVYYVEMERQLGDPSDWSSFQKGLVRALETAFGWEPAEPGGDDLTQNLIALDAIRRDHDPGTEWDAFLEALWQARGSLRSPRATSA